DWHRIASDLDFMLIPNEEGELDGDREKELRDVIRRLTEEYHGNFFYTKFDINIRQDFFRRFPAGGEHFGRISNIPIEENGVVYLSDTKVKAKGKEIDLTRWGLEQFSRHSLEYGLAGDGDPFESYDPAKALRQALRWIRYLSEHPRMELTPEADE